MKFAAGVVAMDWLTSTDVAEAAAAAVSVVVGLAVTVLEAVGVADGAAGGVRRVSYG